jgi:hypothetical protein
MTWIGCGCGSCGHGHCSVVMLAVWSNSCIARPRLSTMLKRPKATGANLCEFLWPFCAPDMCVLDRGAYLFRRLVVHQRRPGAPRRISALAQRILSYPRLTIILAPCRLKNLTPKLGSMHKQRGQLPSDCYHSYLTVSEQTMCAVYQ